MKSVFSTFGIIVFVLGLTGCSTPFKKKAVDPFLGFNFSTVTVQSQNYTEQNAVVTYPVISGLPVKSLQTSINTYLQQEFVPQTILPTEIYSAHFSVRYRKGSIINFMNNGLDYTQGNSHGLPLQDSIILDVKTGSTYGLADLFLPKTAYLTYLTNVVKQQDSRHLLNTLQPFGGVATYDRFYLTGDGFTIFFAPYEWTPTPLGFPSYHITFAEVQQYINTSGPFWKDLNGIQ